MTSQKEKRGTIGARRRRALSLFITELQQLQQQKDFERVRQDIQHFIDEVVTEIARTREGDRQAVVDVLANWQTPLRVDEIMEDVGLNERIVRGVLAELMQAGIVKVSDRPGDTERGHQAKVYNLVECLSDAK